MVNMWRLFYCFWSSAVTKRFDFSTFINCSEEILSVAFKKNFRFGPSTSRTRARAVCSLGDNGATNHSPIIANIINFKQLYLGF